MLFEQEDFAGEPGEDVEETGVFKGVFGEFGFEGLRVEAAEELEVLAGDNLEGGFGQGGGVVGGDHVEGGFSVCAAAGRRGLVAPRGEETQLPPFFSPGGGSQLRDGIRQRRVGGLLEAAGD